MLGSNFVKFLMSVLKRGVDSSPTLYLSSVSWKIIPLDFFSSKNIYIYTLLKRSLLKWKCLRFSSARVKFCQISYANFETRSWFLSKFCIPLQFHERLLLCFFLAQTIYTLLIRSPLKWKSLRLRSVSQSGHSGQSLSAQVKICQVPYANF